jgi:hypothetical protein
LADTLGDNRGSFSVSWRNQTGEMPSHWSQIITMSALSVHLWVFLILFILRLNQAAGRNILGIACRTCLLSSLPSRL